MPKLELEVDDNWHSIQILYPDEAGIVTGTAGAASVNVALPAGYKAIEINCDGPIYWALSTNAGATVSATTGHLFPGAGSKVVPARNMTRIALLRKGSTDVAVSISGLI